MKTFARTMCGAAAALALLTLAGCGHDEGAARAAFTALAENDTTQVLAILDDHDLEDARGPLHVRDQGKPGRGEFPLLHAAVYARNYDVVVRLVKDGADVNMQGPHGIRPMDMLCGAWPRKLTQHERDALVERIPRQSRVAKFLIEQGADGVHYQREMGRALKRWAGAMYRGVMNDPGVQSMDALIRALQRRR